MSDIQFMYECKTSLEKTLTHNISWCETLFYIHYITLAITSSLKKDSKFNKMSNTKRNFVIMYKLSKKLNVEFPDTITESLLKEIITTEKKREDKKNIAKTVIEKCDKEYSYSY